MISYLIFSVLHVFAYFNEDCIFYVESNLWSSAPRSSSVNVWYMISIYFIFLGSIKKFSPIWRFHFLSSLLEQSFLGSSLLEQIGRYIISCLLIAS